MEAIQSNFRLVAFPQAVPPTRAALIAGVRRADAVICALTERVDRKVLEAAPHLKVVANYAVGYNNIDVKTAKARGIIVSNTPDVLTEATADLTWGLLLAVARRILEGDQLVRGGSWSGWEPTQLLGLDVYGKTLGIVGMGRIGQAVARRAAGFRMAVRYCHHGSAPPAGLAGWIQGSFDEVLRQSDFLTLHVPLTEETHHLIGAAELRRVRSTAVLINTSRGPVVDEAALAAALREGRLAGAGLDVFEKEPDVHPGLRALGQVVLLPHLGSATLSTRIRMGMLCVENVLAVLEGRAAPNRVA